MNDDNAFQLPEGIRGGGKTALGIPKGVYCYDETGLCPHWSWKEDETGKSLPHCSHLNLFSNPYCVPIGPDPRDNLIWDQVKECRLNDEIDESQ